MSENSKNKNEKKEKLKYKDIIKNIGMDKLIIIAICGVVLVLFSIPDSSATNSKKNTQSKNNNTKTSVNKNMEISRDTYVKILEKKLETLLRSVKGVGKVKVMITLKDTGEKIVLKEMPYEKSQQNDVDSGGGTSQKTQITQDEAVVYEKDGSGNTIPYVIKVNEPSIMGIAVIAQGGDNAQVVMKITSLIESLFGISTHKISVIGMSE